MRVDARAVAIVALAALALAGCGRAPKRGPSATDATPAPVIEATLGAQADCSVDFADRDGWFGGDAAASIVLPGGDGRRSVWLFGDSFVAREPSDRERRFPFVHNSIAVSRCPPSGGPISLDFVWGSRTAVASAQREPSGEPRAFFEPDPSAAWVARARREAGSSPYYWPLSGVVVEERLYVALLRVAPASPRGPFSLPFRMLGVDLAQIENPRDSPERWRIRVATFSSRPDVLPATALVATRDHLFAFATLERGDGRAPRILARLPTAALSAGASDLEDRVETLATDGRWRRGLDSAEARIVMADDASEMSVHFDPSLGRWLAVYSDTTPDPVSGRRPDVVWLRRATRLEGPWSAPVPLARIPELASAEDPLPGEPFCYAAKAHPELARAGRLLVTYVCNLSAQSEAETAAVLERLRTTNTLYRPRVRIWRVPHE